MPVFFWWRGIPLNYEWTSFFIPYWISVATYSMFVASLFYLIQYGFRTSLCLALRPFSRRKLRLAALALLMLESSWFLGVWKTVVLFSNLLATLAYLMYLRESRKRWLREGLSVFVPATYFSAGFVLIASYNVLMGSIRYFASYVEVFNHLDKMILGGRSVTNLSQFLAEVVSPTVFVLLERIYFFMFPQIGAAIILLTVQRGVRPAMRFVGTVAVAYQLATLIYFLFPSLGPFILTTPISAGLPSGLVTAQIQAELFQKLQLLWQTGTKASIGLDFYIAFPCMHLAQPLIVLWFLRSMKRVVWILAVYDFVMIISIVFLQWHYVVDLVGGALVAVVAIKIHQFHMKRNRSLETDPTHKLQLAEIGDFPMNSSTNT